MKTKGWQAILKFTLIQQVKTKSFIIGTIIICVIVAAVCVLSNVLPVALGGSSETGDITINPDGSADGDTEYSGLSFSAVYLRDEIGILTADDFLSFEESGIFLEPTAKSQKEIQSFLEELSHSETETDPQAALIIDANRNSEDNSITDYSVFVLYSRGGEDDAELVCSVASEIVNRRNMLNLGVSEENYPQTQIPVSQAIIEAGSEQWDIFTSILNYFVPIVVSLVLFLLIFTYGQMVAQSIATEKTSRVMELLLTSVRPLAVVIGKVLAMGIISFSQFILIGAVGAISLAISAPFGFLGQVQGIMNSPEFSQFAEQAASGATVSGITIDDVQMATAVSSFMESFSPFNIILILIVFLLGFLFFSLVAALVGASISRMEDLNAAMQPFSLMGVLGMYLAYFPVIFNVGSLDTGVATTNPVQMFSYYFPISSPFALPSAILLGTLSKLQCVIATVVLAASVVLVAILVSKVYEAIILHNGNRIKISDMIKMATRK